MNIRTKDQAKKATEQRIVQLERQQQKAELQKRRDWKTNTVYKIRSQIAKAIWDKQFRVEVSISGTVYEQELNAIVDQLKIKGYTVDVAAFVNDVGSGVNIVINWN